MSEPAWAPLTGFRVAVTSARRADELSALLQRRGATVTSAAAIEMVPLPDDDALRAYTEALIADAARHRHRHHRHRFPGLGRGGRRLGAGQRPDRGSGQSAHRVAWPQGDGSAARRGTARGMVAGLRVLTRAAALPRRGRHRRPSHRGAVARRHRGVGSVPRVPRRTARRRCGSGADPGLPLARRSPQRGLRPTGGGYRRGEVRRRELHLRTGGRVGVDARRRRWVSRTRCSLLCARPCTPCASGPSPPGHWCDWVCRRRRQSE